MLHLLEGKYIYISYLEFFCTGDLFPTSLFIYLSNSSYQHGLLTVYHTLGYNAVLPYLFCCSHYSSFGYWVFFQLVPISLWHTPSILGVFLSTSLLSGTMMFPAHLVLFPVPVLEPAISPRNLCFFYWRIVLETKIWGLVCQSSG